MTVDLFIPCFIDQLFPETGFNVVELLKKAGVEISYNPNQTCCGQPSFNSGYWKETREIAAKFIKDFPEDRPVVIPSASCAGFIKNYYPELSVIGFYTYGEIAPSKLNGPTRFQNQVFAIF